MQVLQHVFLRGGVLRRRADFVFRFPVFLAIRNLSGPGRFVLHGDNGLHQYADPDNGPGSLARPGHGDARVDVLGDDPVRFFYGGSNCDACRGAGDDVCGSSFMSGRRRAVCLSAAGTAIFCPKFSCFSVPIEMTGWFHCHRRDSRQGGGHFISSKKWTLSDFPL